LVPGNAPLASHLSKPSRKQLPRANVEKSWPTSTTPDRWSNPWPTFFIERQVGQLLASASFCIGWVFMLAFRGMSLDWAEPFKLKLA
jgi:hypothetical protein